MPNSDIKITADIVLNTSSADSSLDKLREKINNTLSRVDSSGADKGFEKIAAKTRDAMTQTEAYENRLKSLQSQLQTAISEAHKGNAVFGASDQYKNAISSVAQYQRKIEELQTALAENARNASLPQAIQMPSMSAEQIAQAEQQISQYQAKIQELEATMTSMETRGTAFPALSQGIKKAEVELSATTTQALLLQQNLEAVSGTAPTTGSAVQQSMQKVSQSVTQGAQQVQQAKQTMSQPTDMQSMAQSVNSLTVAVNNLIKSLQGASSGFSNMRTSASNVGKSASSSLAPLGKTIKGVFGNTGKFASLVGGKLQGAFNKVRNSAEEAFSPKRIKHGLTTLIKYTFGVRSLFFLFRKLRKAVKEGIENLVQYESKTGSASKGVKSTNAAISSLRTSLLYLKNAWAAAFAPIINAVMPLLTTLIDGIANAANYIAKFVGALTGQKIVLNAVKTSAGDYAKSLDKDSDSADKAAKSQKKLNDRLAQFDDLNVLGKDDDTGSGSDAGSGSTFTPDPANMFTTVGTGSAKSLADMIKDAWNTADFTNIGKAVSDKLYAVLAGIKFEDKLKPLASKMGKSLATFFNGLFGDNKLWNISGETIAKIVNTIGTGINSFLKNIKVDFGGGFASLINSFFKTVDWKQVYENIKLFGDQLVKNINSFFKTLDLSKISMDLGGLAQSLTGMLVSLIDDVDWEQVGNALFLSFGNAISGGIENALKGSNNPLIKVLGDTLSTIRQSANDLLPVIGQIMSSVGQAIQAILPALSAALPSIVSLIQQIATTVLPVLVSAIQTLTPILSQIISTILPVLSQVLTALSPIFTTLAKTLLPAIASAISQLLPVITPIITQLVSMLVPVLTNLVTTLLPVLQGIFNAILPILQQILPIIMSIVQTLLPVFSQILAQIMPTIQQVVEAILPIVVKLLDIIAPLISDILTSLADLVGPVLGLLSPILESITSTIEPLLDIVRPIVNIVRVLLNLVVSILQPIIELIEPIMKIINDCLSPIFSLFGLIGTALETVIVPLLKLLAGVIQTIVLPILKLLVAGVKLIVDAFGNVSTAVNFVIGLFKLGFEQLGKWFKGFVNGFLDSVGGFINGFIKALNAGIRGINKLAIDIPDWVPVVGGKKLGFNIKELNTINIPKLAEGAVIPPNREFMAMLGDQSHGTNIEAPLDTIKQAVAEVVGNNGSAEMIRLLQQLIGVVESKQLNIGDAEIGKANARYNKQQSIRRGTSF